jgi:hypothetical protein
MLEPKHEQFRGGRPVALYRAVAPVMVKDRSGAEPRQVAAGELREVRGYPAAALMPVSSEAAYAKFAAIRREVKAEGWLRDAPLIAASLGAGPLSQSDATTFIESWMRNPKPVGDL